MENDSLAESGDGGSFDFFLALFCFFAIGDVYKRQVLDKLPIGETVKGIIHPENKTEEKTEEKKEEKKK